MPRNRLRAPGPRILPAAPTQRLARLLRAIALNTFPSGGSERDLHHRRFLRNSLLLLRGEAAATVVQDAELPPESGVTAEGGIQCVPKLIGATGNAPRLPPE